MKNNSIILLLRFSDNHGIDTIERHKSVIDENGFCWWAKIGKQPSEKYLKDFVSQEDPIILLYKPGHLYKCSYGGIINERPKDSYPKYYSGAVFGLEKEPSVYFKLNSIEEIKLDFLEDYIVRSSEKEVLYDLKKTISSYMFVQHKDAPRKVKVKREIKKKTIAPVNTRGCVYRKNESCTNRNCINYKYECLHPELCLKQKIK